MEIGGSQDHPKTKPTVQLPRLRDSSQPEYSSTYIITVIAAYWIVSISMVYLNKLLLSNNSATIPAPLFVTWFQCIITCLICVILGNLGERSRTKGFNSFLNDFPKIKISGGDPHIGIFETTIHFCHFYSLCGVCSASSFTCLRRHDCLQQSLPEECGGFFL